MPFAAGRPDWKFWHKTIREGTVPGGLCPLFLPEVICLSKGIIGKKMNKYGFQEPYLYKMSYIYSFLSSLILFTMKS
jgi:hypothetical protein